MVERKNRRVLIATVYNSYNCGSALQAVTLYKAIEKLGYEAYFLNTHARCLKKRILKNVIRYASKLRIKKIREQIVLYRTFSDFLKPYKTIEVNQIDKQHDCFVLGSDEIWNISRPEMLRYPVFWGEGLPRSRTLSYAPSINQANADTLRQHSFVCDAISELHSVSVRDAYSKEVLCHVKERDIHVVCDPTHLMEKEFYDQWSLHRPFSDYVLVYGDPTMFSVEATKMIKEFARLKGKKVISFFFDMDWVDDTVKGGPREFLTYVKYADYIAGVSLHIAAFSILFQKNFACLCDSNTKVMELLSSVGVSDRMLGHPYTSLKQIFETPIDYLSVESIIASSRASSLSFLEESIREIFL